MTDTPEDVSRPAGRGLLERAILGFAPDLMIVDKRAAGIGGELL